MEAEIIAATKMTVAAKRHHHLCHSACEDVKRFKKKRHLAANEEDSCPVVMMKLCMCYYCCYYYSRYRLVSTRSNGPASIQDDEDGDVGTGRQAVEAAFLASPSDTISKETTFNIKLKRASLQTSSTKKDVECFKNNNCDFWCCATNNDRNIVATTSATTLSGCNFNYAANGTCDRHHTVRSCAGEAAPKLKNSDSESVFVTWWLWLYLLCLTDMCLYLYKKCCVNEDSCSSQLMMTTSNNNSRSSFAIMTTFSDSSSCRNAKKNNSSHFRSNLRKNNHNNKDKSCSRPSMSSCRVNWLLVILAFLSTTSVKETLAFGGNNNEFDKTEPLLDKINLEQSIAAVFNKVAYGSTTKRSIPDNAYPVTTLATPLLTTYRYSDGNNEWQSVDLTRSRPRPDAGTGAGRGGGFINNNGRDPGAHIDDDEDSDEGEENDNSRGGFQTRDEDAARNPDFGYGSDLEKDHALPTSAPAADILKNNNNKHYENPNRYNNDRLRPITEYEDGRNKNNKQQFEEHVTESIYKTTTNYNVLRTVRPTKSIYSKDIPSYVPPSRAFFTPPLPAEYFNSFADKPTLRGTNSDGFVNRRPIPPPSLMPNKDRIPLLPPSKVNSERYPTERPDTQSDIINSRENSNNNKKKPLNTPSQNSNNLDRLGQVYGLNRGGGGLNDSTLTNNNFEYEKDYIPSITRILSGSNGRPDDISDILWRTVTTAPNVQQKTEHKTHTKTRTPLPEKAPDESRNSNTNNEDDDFDNKQQQHQQEVVKKPAVEAPYENLPATKKEIVAPSNTGGIVDSNSNKPLDGVTHKTNNPNQQGKDDVTTQLSSDIVNLPNRKEKRENVTQKAGGNDEIWVICWNVHVYFVVVCYVILAICSIYKLIRYENDPHMFSKSYFLTIHLMLTVICVLRIFYLTYDPYNVHKSFNVFLYDFLHNFPLSLLATTFAVLILFLLKRTLTHLKVKTRPVFLVLFGVMHIFLCFCLSISETLGHFERASLIVCRPVFVLLAWALGVSYLYLYKIIKNVLAKKSQNLSEMSTQNISYASHITIAVALLFVLLGFVQLAALFFIKIDHFNGEIKHHWILWGFELSVRLLELSIVTLIAVVVSLKMSQREKQIVGFPLFPCTTSDSSTDNIYPNNCNTNPNAMNYNSRNDVILDNMATMTATTTEAIERPNLNLLVMKNAFQNDSFDKKSTSTLERCYQKSGDNNGGGGGNNFERFERPSWGGASVGSSERFDSSSSTNHHTDEQTSLNLNFGAQQQQQAQGHFERGSVQNQSRNSSNNNAIEQRNSARKGTYDSAKYYAKPKYDLDFGAIEQIDYNSEQEQLNNVYSEPIDQNSTNGHHHQYERTRHEFEFERNGDFDGSRRSRNSSSNTSGRRSTGRARKNHARPHLGVQTLPNHDRHQLPDSVLVDDQGFLRFKMQEYEQNKQQQHLHEHPHYEQQLEGATCKVNKRNKKHITANDVNHYSDA